jgi:hypothetical protein
MASHSVTPSATVFMSLLVGDCLTAKSVLLHNGLQRGLLHLTPLSQGWLSQPRDWANRLWARNTHVLDSQLTGLCFDSPDIASARTHREHSFPHFLYFCMTSLQTRMWRAPLLLVSTSMATWPDSIGNVFTELLLRNDHLCLLNYSGFQRTCHETMFVWEVLPTFWTYMFLHLQVRNV